MSALPPPAQLALDEMVGRRDPGIVGVVLSGSAARGMATERSDVDVYVVTSDASAAGIRRSRFVDEISLTLAELESPRVFGTDEWWSRWSFAWAQVLRDDTGGRVTAAVLRQATLAPDEQQPILLDRLDGYINFVYRALKADRDGRALERRLDAAESVPWLLDTIFTLHGRVRPYNKYLAWELREHPLGVPEWGTSRLLPQLEAMLSGDAAALRAAFAIVERECVLHDEIQGSGASRAVIDGWGDEIQLLRAVD